MRHVTLQERPYETLAPEERPREAATRPQFVQRLRTRLAEIERVIVALAIAAQNIPEGLAVALPIRAGGGSRAAAMVFVASDL